MLIVQLVAIQCLAPWWQSEVVQVVVVRLTVPPITEALAVGKDEQWVVGVDL
jgi:hypothetical protein